jgi:hypothetical protein
LGINYLSKSHSWYDGWLFLINFGEKLSEMEYGICILPVIPLRKEPNDRSELLTQMLFGETARIFETNPKWVSVETDLDRYPGWLDAKQIQRISKVEYDRINRAPLCITLDPLTYIEDGEKGGQLLPACSSLPGFKGNKLTINGNTYHLSSGRTKPFAEINSDGIAGTAISFLNAPYLWGGRTHLGIDCSGFTQAVYRLNGINLPRDSSQQAGAGEAIAFLSEAIPGDLAFFDDHEGNIIHVGLIVDSRTIIHSSGKVRIDTLDHQGIYNEEIRNYSHTLRLIRRITAST